MFKRTCILNGIQFTRHFSEFVLVETSKVVRSNSNVILTRQTCGQRLSRVAGSLASCFSIRIWYVFLTSKCRGELDLGLCMTSVLAKRMWLHRADFRFENVFGRKIRRMLSESTNKLNAWNVASIDKKIEISGCGHWIPQEHLFLLII